MAVRQVEPSALVGLQLVVADMPNGLHRRIQFGLQLLEGLLEDSPAHNPRQVICAMLQRPVQRGVLLLW